MQQLLTTAFSEVLMKQESLPCISIILPFEPKMTALPEIMEHLKSAVDKVKGELSAVYEPQTADPVIKKLQLLIKDLNYNTHKKTIAIFVSPQVAKVYYLDIAVEEKIIIDDSFEIRDLIYSKKQLHKYLLAELGSKWTKIYLGHNDHFVTVISNMPDHIAAYKNDVSDGGAHHTDKKKEKEVLLDRFLRHTDKGLSILLDAFHLPLFVMGTDRTIGHFKAVTRNAKHVIEYIHGHFENHTEASLHKIMEPHVADWKKVMQADLMNQVEAAKSQHRLSSGMRDVWKAAVQLRGKLLIVSKNFMYPAVHDPASENIFSYQADIKTPFYIKDAVDDVIEKVLGCGGDVEFVDEDLLEEYGHIVLIEFYPHPQ